MFFWIDSTTLLCAIVTCEFCVNPNLSKIFPKIDPAMKLPMAKIACRFFKSSWFVVQKLSRRLLQIDTKEVSACNHNSLLKRKTYGSVSPGRELSLKAYHFRFFPSRVLKCWFVKHIFLNYNQIQILITPSLFMWSKKGCSETQIPVLVRLTHI